MCVELYTTCTETENGEWELRHFTYFNPFCIPKPFILTN